MENKKRGKTRLSRRKEKRAVEKGSLVPNSDKNTWPQVSKNLISVFVLDLENVLRVNVSHAHAKKAFDFLDLASTSFIGD